MSKQLYACPNCDLVSSDGTYVKEHWKYRHMCRRCQGTGKYNKDLDCPECRGKGVVRR